MTTVSLSKHDLNVLEKIKDPEFDASRVAVIDDSLPADPHIRVANVYDEVTQKERKIIQSIQQLEAEFNQSQTLDCSEVASQGYKVCLADLTTLISEYPSYASAKNNRAQMLRRLYGDALLLDNPSTTPAPVIENPGRGEKKNAAVLALNDLQKCIALLSPPSPSTPLSPQTAKTLSMAHTQRAAIYLRTAKLLPFRSLDIYEELPEARWTSIDFEEAASQDLALGGRYGNEIAKSLAVSVNPTAKLCGQMVRQAMKKEYGPSFEV